MKKDICPECRFTRPHVAYCKWALQNKKKCRYFKAREGANGMKKSYFVRMSRLYCGTQPWGWEIVTYNGHVISFGKTYKNRTNCRNVAKGFADSVGFEFREEGLLK